MPMLSFFYLAIMVLYVAICYWFTLYVVRRSKDKAVLKGIIAFLLYNTPLGWQVIPTVIMHSLACNENAGFTLYKTPEQWKIENPSVASTLIKSSQTTAYRNKNTRTLNLNQRFRWVTEYNKVNSRILNVKETVVDIKTKEIMALRNDYHPQGGIGFESGCFKKEERSKWEIGNKVFGQYKWLYTFKGEEK